jgi:hypothetical protein
VTSQIDNSLNIKDTSKTLKKYCTVNHTYTNETSREEPSKRQLIIIEEREYNDMILNSHIKTLAGVERLLQPMLV